MRILIAEDEPIIALALAERLRILGHQPLGPAGDGLEALDAARAEHPDLYLFDIDMPRLDGLRAAQQLADEGVRRPVVVLTGVEDPGLVERSVSSGVSAYLTKPIDDRQLDAAIKLAAARHDELLRLEAELQLARQSLADRKLIERAKGVLMDALGLSEADAFARLQHAARNRNLRLPTVAQQVIDQRDLLRTSRAPTAPER
ncbi:MAG: response regulator [Solirubrobacteraceae bacterium]